MRPNFVPPSLSLILVVIMAITRMCQHGEWRWTLKKPTVPMKNALWSIGLKLLIIPVSGLMLAGYYVVDHLAVVILCEKKQFYFWPTSPHRPNKNSPYFSIVA